MKLIKNAICYRITLPATPLLEKHLNELRHAEIQEAEASKLGFTPVEITGAETVAHSELVTAFSGGCVFALRIQEKIIPAAVLKAETKRRCSEWAAERGMIRAPKDVREGIRAAVLAEFVRRALVRTTAVTAFYHRSSRLLFVSGTKKQAGALVSMLVTAVGAAKTETINVSDVKGGLTARMQSHVDTGEGFSESFVLESGVWLARSKERITAQMEELDEARKAIAEALEGQFKVEAIRLTHADSGVSFKLTSDFHLKSIQGLDADAREAGEGAVETWLQEAAVQTQMMVSVLDDLCTMFDYKAPEEDPSEKEEEVLA